jgi:hypothetical protein
MGAAEWSVDIAGVGKFDLRAMDRHQRGKFHGLFMSSFRKLVRTGEEPTQKQPQRHQRRRHTGGQRRVA